MREDLEYISNHWWNGCKSLTATQDGLTQMTYRVMHYNPRTTSSTNYPRAGVVVWSSRKPISRSIEGLTTFTLFFQLPDSIISVEPFPMIGIFLHCFSSKLTNPVIPSQESLRHGPSDPEPKAISNFFYWHHCGLHCKPQWIKASFDPSVRWMLRKRTIMLPAHTYTWWTLPFDGLNRPARFMKCKRNREAMLPQLATVRALVFRE